MSAREFQIPSESESIDEVLRAIARIKKYVPLQELDELDQALYTLHSLRNHARGGMHRNPPLTIFAANPPSVRKKFRGDLHGRTIKLEMIGEIGECVHDIRYTHVDDEQDYEHLFEYDDVKAVAVMFGSRRAVLLIGSEDIWDDY